MELLLINQTDNIYATLVTYLPLAVLLQLCFFVAKFIGCSFETKCIGIGIIVGEVYAVFFTHHYAIGISLILFFLLTLARTGFFIFFKIREEEKSIFHASRKRDK